MTRQEELIALFERAIVSGELRPGERLPTIRALSGEHGVSGATVAAAYRVLQHRGLVRGEVGRGTFVIERPHSSDLRRSSPFSEVRQSESVRGIWRRRAVSATASRLRDLYPEALDCTSGKPNIDLLPVASLKRAWHEALEQTNAADLQYASPAPIEQLSDSLRRLWTSDNIDTTGKRITIGSSAQQLMTLSISVVSQLKAVTRPTILVEEPGFQTVFDALERQGAQLQGFSLDHHGADPEALAFALSKTKPDAVLFTPRGQNPTGRSWTSRRRKELGDVLAEHAHLLVIEDDQFADLASSSPGSLINDKRLTDRTIHIRSFSKTIAPDLRLAAALASPMLSNMLAEAKGFSDGWSSRLAQRTLAILLDDPETIAQLNATKASYAAKRTTAVQIINEHVSMLGPNAECADGLNVWVSLPRGFSAADIVERAAELGVLVISGEPFFVQPGHDSYIRMSVSQLLDTDVETAATRLSDAIRSDASVRQATPPI